jgi:hypothetical protein
LALGGRTPVVAAIEIVPNYVSSDELNIAALAISFIAIIKGIPLVPIAILRDRISRETRVTTKEFVDYLLSAALSFSLGIEAKHVKNESYYNEKPQRMSHSIFPFAAGASFKTPCS